MDFLRRLLGFRPDWDGSDRRSSLRARCDFDLVVQGKNLEFHGRALDASPKGIRVRIRGHWNPRSVKHGVMVSMRCPQPPVECEVDTIQGRISWVKRLDKELFLLAISFEDTIDHLRRSWVKPVLMKGLHSKVRQQRGFVRVACNLPVQFAFHGEVHEGKLHDLSVQGGRLETLHIFSQGSHLELRLRAHELPPLNIRSVVRRADVKLSTGFYGLNFLIEEPAKKVLLRYVRAVLEDSE